MKIEVRNLNKSFGEKEVIKNLNLKIEGNQLYSIVGDSGCGKTTLLNILSFIIKPNNNDCLFYDGINFSKLSDSELRKFRIDNCGYVFQSINLFENDTVKNNLLLLLESHYSSSKISNDSKINSVLKELNIEYLKDKYVRDLSGGEKQRVAIARALINDPKIIFADEPTGSLDSVNSEIVFSLLKKISKKCLVIVVTHDESLANKYADTIYDFNNNIVREISDIKSEPETKRKIKNKKASISMKFIFNKFVNNFKLKRTRNLMLLFILSISMFGISFSFSLKDTIENSITNSIESMMGNNSIVVTKKNNSSEIIDYNPATKKDIERIYFDYKSDIEYYGATYLNNYEEFFIDENAVYNISRPLSVQIENLNFRSFMEFNYLDSTIDSIYPNNLFGLDYDEIILSLDYQSMKSICQYLYIERSYEVLGDFCKTNKFVINLSLQNDEWEYIDNVSFVVKGVIEDNEVCVYHDKSDFNEYLFEKTLMFPSTQNFKKVYDVPWMLRKVYYVKTKDFQSSFLNKIMSNRNYENFVFDNDNENYSYKYFSNPNNSIYTNKLYVYEVYSNSIPLSFCKSIKNVNDSFNSFFYSTNGGYLDYGNAYYSGFAKRTFFANNTEDLENIVDAYSKINYKDSIELEDNILSSYIYDSSSNNVKLTSFINGEIEGSEPYYLDDILISSSMSESLNIGINQPLYLLHLKEDNYEIVELNVSGIFEDNYPKIYADDNFSISLFRDLLRISSFDLLPVSIIYQFDTLPTSDELKELNNHFVSYKFCNPIENLSFGINDTLEYLNYLMIFISTVSIISSIILLIMITYVQIIESKKDCSILAYLGFTNNEISNAEVSSISLTIVISFIFSLCLFYISNMFLNQAIGETIGVIANTTFDIKIILYLLLIVLVLILLISIVSKVVINRINIAKEIH